MLHSDENPWQTTNRGKHVIPYATINRLIRTISIWNKEGLNSLGGITSKSDVIGKTPRLKVNDDFIFCGSDNVGVWNKSNLSFITTLTGHTDMIFDITADKNHVYTVTRDQTIRVWIRG